MTDKNTYKQCECVEMQNTKKLWEEFGIKPEEIKRLSEYEVYNQELKSVREKVVKYVESFKENREKRENSLGLFGQSGAGKTHIALAVARALIEKGIAVTYMPYLETMRILKASALDVIEYDKLINRYSKCKVLIIDDLFKDKLKNGKLATDLTEADMKHIYPILNYRYINKLPMIISSECYPEQLMTLDEALGGRILESCSDFGIEFSKNCNYRIRKFKK